MPAASAATPGSRMLLLREHEVERPTSTDMRPRASQVVQEVGVVAASFLEGIGKDGEACGVEFARRQSTVVVDGSGKSDHGGCLPCMIDGGGPEGVAEDAADEATLDGGFLGTESGCCVTSHLLP